MFGLRTRKERNSLRVEKKERILSQSLRSFARTAKGKNSSNRVQNRQLKSRTRTTDGGRSLSLPPSLRSFAPSIDQMRFLRDHSRRFSKDFRMPPPPPPPPGALRISRAERSAAQKRHKPAFLLLTNDIHRFRFALALQRVGFTFTLPY